MLNFLSLLFNQILKYRRSLIEENSVMQYRNMDSLFRGVLSSRKGFDLFLESIGWKNSGQYRVIEYLDGEFLQFVFGNSFELERLQRESERLISHLMMRLKIIRLLFL